MSLVCICLGFLYLLIPEVSVYLTCVISNNRFLLPFIGSPLITVEYAGLICKGESLNPLGYSEILDHACCYLM
jgi:hypothetical protein